MPLKQVSKEQYEALYREALFLLKKLCQHKKHSDHEDIAHLSLEIYFMKRDSKNSVSLEQAAQEALLDMPCQEKPKIISVEEEHKTTSSAVSQREAQRDLDKIYLIVRDSLSLEEKYIFCMLLKDVPASAIIKHLGLAEADFIKAKDSLIGKLRDAATSPTEQRYMQKTSDLCLGKLKEKNIRN